MVSFLGCLVWFDDWGFQFGLELRFFVWFGVCFYLVWGFWFGLILGLQFLVWFGLVWGLQFWEFGLVFDLVLDFGTRFGVWGFGFDI